MWFKVKVYGKRMKSDHKSSPCHFVTGELKTEAIIFPADGILLNFFGGGESGCFHSMLCFLDFGSK
jgi:hypothetical protein